MNNYSEMKTKIESLAIFSAIKEDPVVLTLHRLLDELSVSAYSDFLARLYPNGSDLAKYIRNLVLEDDNFYVRAVASGQKVDAEIEEAVKRELIILEEIAAIPPEEIRNVVSDHCNQLELPLWKNSPLTLRSDFTGKLSNISSTGYGIYAKHNFFRITDEGITPVVHPDFQQLGQLYGYQRERDLIIRNTEALIMGKDASNMLLYGDMGTGKSSSIKAVTAYFADQGLRLIEIKKDQLFQIPEIMDELASNPLKFILFIDDLSFAGNDDNFSALKASLEGSVCGCGNNTVIYATSNRRHLVRESASDRQGLGADDDLHVNDTLQETMSLSARFGLTITFGKPNKDEYLSIVRGLAEEYGIPVSDDGTGETITEIELFQKAEAFAIRKNGRSPRTAKQFIELLKIGI